MNEHFRTILGGVFLSLLIEAPCDAGEILGTNTIVAIDPASGGMIELISTVYELPGNWARYEYKVTNSSFDPDPPLTNGFSGLHLTLTIGPFYEDFFAPEGWSFSFVPGKQLHFEIPFDEGFGVAIGEFGVFGFNSNVQGFFQWFGNTGNSHNVEGVTNSFSLRDIDSGARPLVPIPTPGVAAVLIGVYLVGGLRCRRRSG